MGVSVLTIQQQDSSQGKQGPVLGMLQDIASLQTVEERYPGQVTKCQHEAKPIMHNVHRAQYGLLQTQQYIKLNGLIDIFLNCLNVRVIS